MEWVPPGLRVAVVVVGLFAIVAYGVADDLAAAGGGQAPAPVASCHASRARITPQAFAADLLACLNAPRTPANRAALVAWQCAEGGHVANAARYNPLNTTKRMGGSRPMNAVGVQAFPSYRVGLDATVATLRNGRYGEVLAALDRGDDAGRVARAVLASPWGTNAAILRCLDRAS